MTASPPRSDINAIARVALDVYDQDVSIWTQLRRTGYRYGEALRADQLIPILTVHPEWVDAWITLADDKRSTGWYIQQRDNEFAVRSYPPSTDRPPMFYDDRVSAVAEFIVREVDDVSKPWLASLRQWLANRLRKPSSG